MSASSERRLVAVITDVVGYTALMQADEQQAVAKRDLYVDALRREFKQAGDAAPEKTCNSGNEIVTSSCATSSVKRGGGGDDDDAPDKNRTCARGLGSRPDL